jgi:hypothetical protein
MGLIHADTHGDNGRLRNLHPTHLGDDKHQERSEEDVTYLRDWTVVCLGSASQPLLNWGLGPLLAVPPPAPIALCPALSIS